MKLAMAKELSLAGRLNLRPRMSQLPRSPGLNCWSYTSSGGSSTRLFTCSIVDGFVLSVRGAEEIWSLARQLHSPHDSQHEGRH